MAKTEFVPEAAYQYATEIMGWEMPKKLKSPDTLMEIVAEKVDLMLKDIPEEERYGCEACNSTVGEPDEFCWYCGADITDDGTGGFEPTGKDLFGNKTEYEKPKEEEKKIEPEMVAPKKEEGKKDKPKKDKPKKDKPKKDKPKKDKPKKDKQKKDKPEKAKPVEAEVVEEEPVTELEPHEKIEQIEVKSLKEYTFEIRRLDQTAGSHAWMIGKYLTDIKESKAFKQGGYDTLADYVQAELDYSWQVARNFMRYAKIVTDHSQAAKLGVYKMEVIARCPEDSRPKLLKAALPKPEGQGNSAKQLEQKLKVEKEKKALAGKGDKKSNRGRKAEPNKKITLHDLIGETLKIPIKDGTGEVIIPDSQCLIEIKELKNSVNLTFYQVEIEEE